MTTLLRQVKRKLKESHFGPLLCYCTELFANLRFLWSKLLKFQSHNIIKSLKYLEPLELLLSWTITTESFSYCVWHFLCKVDVVGTRSAFQHSLQGRGAAFGHTLLLPPLKQCMSVGALHPVWLLNVESDFSVLVISGLKRSLGTCHTKWL